MSEQKIVRSGNEMGYQVGDVVGHRSRPGVKGTVTQVGWSYVVIVAGRYGGTWFNENVVPLADAVQVPEGLVWHKSFAGGTTFAYDGDRKYVKFPACGTIPAMVIVVDVPDTLPRSAFGYGVGA